MWLSRWASGRRRISEVSFLVSGPVPPPQGPLGQTAPKPKMQRRIHPTMPAKGWGTIRPTRRQDIVLPTRMIYNQSANYLHDLRRHVFVSPKLSQDHRHSDWFFQHDNLREGPASRHADLETHHHRGGPPPDSPIAKDGPGAARIQRRHGETALSRLVSLRLPGLHRPPRPHIPPPSDRRGSYTLRLPQLPEVRPPHRRAVSGVNLRVGGA